MCDMVLVTKHLICTSKSQWNTLVNFSLVIVTPVVRGSLANPGQITPAGPISEPTQRIATRGGPHSPVQHLHLHHPLPDNHLPTVMNKDVIWPLNNFRRIQLLKIDQTHRDAQIMKIYWCYFWGSMQTLGIFRLTWDIFHTAWYWFFPCKKWAKIYVFMMSLVLVLEEKNSCCNRYNRCTSLTSALQSPYI